MLKCLGIDTRHKFDIKKVYRAEAVAPLRYTFNFSSLCTPFPSRCPFRHHNQPSVRYMVGAGG